MPSARNRIASVMAALVLACGLTLVAAAPAFAAPVVDIDNTSGAFGPGSGSQPGFGYAQSFTPGITGDLTSVTFSTNYVSSASAPARLVTVVGGALTSTVIATGAITTSTATELTYTFSAPAPVVEGTVYAVDLGFASGIKINNNGHAGGTEYADTGSGFFPLIYDFVFTTSVEPLAPSPITGLGATPAPNAIDLDWSAPTTGGSVRGYLVEFRATGAPSWQTFGTVTTTSAQVTGLTGGTPYDVQVTSVGVAQSSSPVATSATPTIPAPGVVTGFTATPGVNSASLAWTAPTTGGPVVDYLVEYRTTGAATWQTFASVTTTTALITGLTGGAPYDFQVTAVGPDASSAPVVASGTPTIPAPGAVTALTATPDDDAVALAWGAPSTGGAVVDYLVEYRVSGAAGWQIFGSTTTPSAQITGLVGGTAYEFQVTAVGPDASSAPASASATPTVPAPGSVTGLTATPGVGFVQLSWTAPTAGGPVDDYLVEFRVAGALVWQTSASVTTTSARVSALTAGVSYEFRVTAVGPDAASAAAALSAVPSAAPAAALAAAGTDSGSVTLLAALLLLLGTAAIAVGYRRTSAAR